MSAIATNELALAGVYRLAARVFGEELDFAALRQVRELLPLLTHSPGDPEPKAVLGLEEEDALVETAVEYCRLFIGPRPIVLTRPDGPGTTARQARAATRPLLERIGISVRSSSRLPEDHLAVWLAVLAELHAAAASSGDGRRSAAGDALREVASSPVRPWLQATLTAVVANACVWPYRPLGRAALAAISATVTASRTQVVPCEGEVT